MLPSWLAKVIGAVLCVRLATAFAAPTAPAWTHQSWQLADGLPNNFVVGTARTPDGYLWVGTRTNLSRFDGSRFEKIPTADFWKGPPQGLRLVQPSMEGGLWLGLDDGSILHLTDGAVRTAVNEPLKLVPMSLVEESRDVLWVSFRKGLLYRIAAGRAERIGPEQGLPTGATCSVARDTTGQIWCARGRSLGRLRGKTFEPACALEGRDAVICAARAGGLWVYCSGKLLRFSPATGLKNVSAVDPGHSTIAPLLLLEDRSGAVWLGTLKSGLLRFGDGRVDPVSTTDRQIESLAEERDGSMWVGTAGGGLNRISRQAINRETDNTGTIVNALSLCEDTAGVIWAAGVNGDLLRRTEAGWQVVESNGQTVWRAKGVSAVAADPDASIWIGTRHQSVHRLSGGNLTTFDHASGIESQWINCLLPTKAGALWIAGEKPDALQHLEEGRFVSLPLPAEVHSIRALTEDAAGDIWVGGRSEDNRGIVLRVSGGRITNESDNPMAPPRPIRATSRTDDGDIWIGGPGDHGLVRLRQGRFAAVGREQGLFDCALSQVVADHQGWIWCAADHGLFKVRQPELNDVIAGHAAEVHSVRYNVGADFGGPQGMAAVSPGALCDHLGRLWIPMRSALLRVEPELLPHEDRPPAVHIERVVVDHEVVASYGGLIATPAADLRNRRPLKIPAHHRRLEIQFTALSLGAPQNERLRYRLDGFDDGWVDSNGPRLASYPHLPGGNYRFQVIASNADGIWNKTGDTLAFTIAPFFWQTWWFRTCALIAFGLLVAVAVRIVSFRLLRRRMQVMQQQAALAEERSRIARDLHDQFGSRLTELAMIATSESHQNGDGGSPSELVPVIRELEHDLDTIIWAVNPKNDTLDRVIPYCCRTAGEFLRRSSIACHFEIPDEIPRRQVTPEFRHNIYLVFREATNNVAKHSRASQADICVSLARDELTVRFDDNGCGFDVRAAESRGRNGLSNMRDRVTELGGVFRVESAPATNTVIHFSIPLPP